MNPAYEWKKCKSNSKYSTKISEKGLAQFSKVENIQPKIIFECHFDFDIENKRRKLFLQNKLLLFFAFI